MCISQSQSVAHKRSLQEMFAESFFSPFSSFIILEKSLKSLAQKQSWVTDVLFSKIILMSVEPWVFNSIVRTERHNYQSLLPKGREMCLHNLQNNVL